MTEPADFPAEELELPGLEQPRRPTGEVEASARTTLAALAPDLDDRQAVMAQALVTIARQLDKAVGSRTAKDYGVANLVAQLRDTYLVLAETPEGGEDGDAFDRLARELGRAAVVRDTPESVPQD